MTLQDEVHIHIKLAGEWNKLLDEIRTIPGFHSFLRPPQASELLRHTIILWLLPPYLIGIKNRVLNIQMVCGSISVLYEDEETGDGVNTFLVIY